jgi:hypothetical protein
MIRKEFALSSILHISPLLGIGVKAAVADHDLILVWDMGRDYDDN